MATAAARLMAKPATVTKSAETPRWASHKPAQSRAGPMSLLAAPSSISSTLELGQRSARAHLCPMAQVMIGDHNGEHRFGDWYGADSDARVVPALRRNID